MAITKSKKHKLSLDHDKPNEKGGCTLATPYALMRSLILDSQISIISLGSCTPLHSKGVSQLNKWARDLKWTSRRCIYTPPTEIQPLLSMSANFDTTGCAGLHHRMRRSVQSDCAKKLAVTVTSDTGQRLVHPTGCVRCRKTLSSSLLDSIKRRWPMSSATLFRLTRH
jgi:hypothetical protein